MRVAVVGAGVSGLAAIKCCRDEGLDVVCFETRNDLGGLWNYTETVLPGQSNVARSGEFFLQFVILPWCLQCFDAVGWAAGRGHAACKKTEWWGAGVVICLERSADLHMAQPMPLLLTVSCFSEIQIGFTFLVPAHPGSP